MSQGLTWTRSDLAFRRMVGAGRIVRVAIGLAVLTLQKINQNPGFTAGVQVKISRRAVALTRISTDFA